MFCFEHGSCPPKNKYRPVLFSWATHSFLSFISVTMIQISCQGNWTNLVSGQHFSFQFFCKLQNEQFVKMQRTSYSGGKGNQAWTFRVHLNVHSSSDMEISKTATNDLVPLTNAHLDAKWPETERKCNFGCQYNKKWLLLVLYRDYNQLYLLLAQFSYTVTN